ncbi:hypothetical protein V1511DRAFT_308969 [Dipodascopsis uninucleata]
MMPNWITKRPFPHVSRQLSVDNQNSENEDDKNIPSLYQFALNSAVRNASSISISLNALRNLQYEPFLHHLWTALCADTADSFDIFLAFAKSIGNNKYLTELFAKESHAKEIPLISIQYDGSRGALTNLHFRHANDVRLRRNKFISKTNRHIRWQFLGENISGIELRDVVRVCSQPELGLWMVALDIRTSILRNHLIAIIHLNNLEFLLVDNLEKTIANVWIAAIKRDKAWPKLVAVSSTNDTEGAITHIASQSSSISYIEVKPAVCPRGFIKISKSYPEETFIDRAHLALGLESSALIAAVLGGKTWTGNSHAQAYIRRQSTSHRDKLEQKPKIKQLVIKKRKSSLIDLDTAIAELS